MMDYHVSKIILEIRVENLEYENELLRNNVRELQEQLNNSYKKILELQVKHGDYAHIEIKMSS